MNVKFNGMTKNEKFKLIVNDSSSLILESDNYIFKIDKSNNNNVSLSSRNTNKTMMISVDSVLMNKIKLLPTKLKQLDLF